MDGPLSSSWPSSTKQRLSGGRLLKPLKAWFSIETRLNVFQALNDQELSYFHNTLLEGCNIVRYDHTTWWLLWLQYFKVSGY